VDIVIQLADKRLLSAVAAALGGDFDFDTQVTFETLTGNVRHIVRLPGTPFVIELFELGEDAFQQQRFARRVSLFVPQIGQSVSLPRPEDVVVQKIRWGRPKDLEDARDVLAVQGDDLEMKYIEVWCEKHGTLDRLKRLLAEIPEM
jgi:hypothetical protein